MTLLLGLVLLVAPPPVVVAQQGPQLGDRFARFVRGCQGLKEGDLPPHLTDIEEGGILYDPLDGGEVTCRPVTWLTVRGATFLPGCTFRPWHELPPNLAGLTTRTGLQILPAPERFRTVDGEATRHVGYIEESVCRQSAATHYSSSDYFAANRSILLPAYAVAVTLRLYDPVTQQWESYCFALDPQSMECRISFRNNVAIEPKATLIRYVGRIRPRVPVPGETVDDDGWYNADQPLSRIRVNFSTYVRSPTAAEGLGARSPSADAAGFSMSLSFAEAVRGSPVDRLAMGRVVQTEPLGTPVGGERTTTTETPVTFQPIPINSTTPYKFTDMMTSATEDSKPTSAPTDEPKDTGSGGDVNGNASATNDPKNTTVAAVKDAADGFVAPVLQADEDTAWTDGAERRQSSVTVASDPTLHDIALLDSSSVMRNFVCLRYASCSGRGDAVLRMTAIGNTARCGCVCDPGFAGADCSRRAFSDQDSMATDDRSNATFVTAPDDITDIVGVPVQLHVTGALTLELRVTLLQALSEVAATVDVICGRSRGAAGTQHFHSYELYYCLPSVPDPPISLRELAADLAVLTTPAATMHMEKKMAEIGYSGHVAVSLPLRMADRLPRVTAVSAAGSDGVDGNETRQCGGEGERRPPGWSGLLTVICIAAAVCVVVTCLSARWLRRHGCQAGRLALLLFFVVCCIFVIVVGVVGMLALEKDPAPRYALLVRVYGRSAGYGLTCSAAPPTDAFAVPLDNRCHSSADRTALFSSASRGRSAVAAAIAGALDHAPRGVLVRAECDSLTFRNSTPSPLLHVMLSAEDCPAQAPSTNLRLVADGATCYGSDTTFSADVSSSSVAGGGSRTGSFGEPSMRQQPRLTDAFFFTASVVPISDADDALTRILQQEAGALKHPPESGVAAMAGRDWGPWSYLERSTNETIATRTLAFPAGPGAVPESTASTRLTERTPFVSRAARDATLRRPSFATPLLSVDERDTVHGSTVRDDIFDTAIYTGTATTQDTPTYPAVAIEDIDVRSAVGLHVPFPLTSLAVESLPIATSSPDTNSSLEAEVTPQWTPQSTGLTRRDTPLSAFRRWGAAVPFVTGTGLDPTGREEFTLTLWVKATKDSSGLVAAYVDDVIAHDEGAAGSAGGRHLAAEALIVELERQLHRIAATKAAKFGVDDDEARWQPHRFQQATGSSDNSSNHRQLPQIGTTAYLALYLNGDRTVTVASHDPLSNNRMYVVFPARVCERLFDGRWHFVAVVHNARAGYATEQLVIDGSTSFRTASFAQCLPRGVFSWPPMRAHTLPMTVPHDALLWGNTTAAKPTSTLRSTGALVMNGAVGAGVFGVQVHPTALTVNQLVGYSSGPIRANFSSDADSSQIAAIVFFCLFFLLLIVGVLQTMHNVFGVQTAFGAMVGGKSGSSGAGQKNARTQQYIAARGGRQAAGATSRTTAAAGTGGTSSAATGTNSWKKLGVILPMVATTMQSMALYFTAWQWPVEIRIPFGWYVYILSLDFTVALPNIDFAVTFAIQIAIAIVCVLYLFYGRRRDAREYEALVLDPLRRMPADDLDEAAATDAGIDRVASPLVLPQPKLLSHNDEVPAAPLHVTLTVVAGQRLGGKQRGIGGRGGARGGAGQRTAPLWMELVGPPSRRELIESVDKLRSRFYSTTSATTGKPSTPGVLLHGNRMALWVNHKDTSVPDVPDLSWTPSSKVTAADTSLGLTSLRQVQWCYFTLFVPLLEGKMLDFAIPLPAEGQELRSRRPPREMSSVDGRRKWIGYCLAVAVNSIGFVGVDEHYVGAWEVVEQRTLSVQSFSRLATFESFVRFLVKYHGFIASFREALTNTVTRATDIALSRRREKEARAALRSAKRDGVASSVKAAAAQRDSDHLRRPPILPGSPLPPKRGGGFASPNSMSGAFSPVASPVGGARTGRDGGEWDGVPMDEADEDELLAIALAASEADAAAASGEKKDLTKSQTPTGAVVKPPTGPPTKDVTSLPPPPPSAKTQARQDAVAEVDNLIAVRREQAAARWERSGYASPPITTPGVPSAGLRGCRFSDLIFPALARGGLVAFDSHADVEWEQARDDGQKLLDWLFFRLSEQSDRETLRNWAALEELLTETETGVPVRERLHTAQLTKRILEEETALATQWHSRTHRRFTGAMLVVGRAAVQAAFHTAVHLAGRRDRGPSHPYPRLFFTFDVERASPSSDESASAGHNGGSSGGGAGARRSPSTSTTPPPGQQQQQQQTPPKVAYDLTFLDDLHRCPEHGRHLVWAQSELHGAVRAEHGARRAYPCQGRPNRELLLDAGAGLTAVDRLFHEEANVALKRCRKLPRIVEEHICEKVVSARCNETDYLVCQNRDCNFAMCATCCTQRKTSLKVETALATQSYVVRTIGAYSLIGFLIVLAAQALFLPAVKSAVVVIFCHAQLSCNYPGCYTVITPEFVGMVSASLALVLVLGCGLVLLMCVVVYRRKQRLVFSGALSGRFKLNGEVCESDPSSMAEVIRCDLPSDVWRTVLSIDKSMFRVLYEQYEFKFAVFQPITLLFKILLVAVVLFVGEPDTLPQISAAACVEVLQLVFYTATNPFIDPWIDTLAKAGSLHQVLQIALFCQYKTTVAERPDDRTVGFAMFSVALVYLAFVLLVIIVLVAVPWGRGWWEARERKEREQQEQRLNLAAVDFARQQGDAMTEAAAHAETRQYQLTRRNVPPYVFAAKKKVKKKGPSPNDNERKKLGSKDDGGDDNAASVDDIGDLLCETATDTNDDDDSTSVQGTADQNASASADHGDANGAASGAADSPANLESTLRPGAAKTAARPGSNDTPPPPEVQSLISREERDNPYDERHGP